MPRRQEGSAWGAFHGAAEQAGLPTARFRGHCRGRRPAGSEGVDGCVLAVGQGARLSLCGQGSWMCPWPRTPPRRLRAGTGVQELAQGFSGGLLPGSLARPPHAGDPRGTSLSLGVLAERARPLHSAIPSCEAEGALEGSKPAPWGSCLQRGTRSHPPGLWPPFSYLSPNHSGPPLIRPQGRPVPAPSPFPDMLEECFPLPLMSFTSCISFPAWAFSDRQ